MTSSRGVPVELTSDRLHLRPGRASDAVVFRRLWEERDPRVPPHRRIDADGHPTLQEVAEHMGDDPAVFTVVRDRSPDRGDVIGYAGLIARGHGSEEEPELVYELLRAAHGSGYATEAGRVVVDWARGAGYRRLWSGARLWNEPSVRVLTKLGFREVRVDPDPVFGDSVVVVLDLGAAEDVSG